MKKVKWILGSGKEAMVEIECSRYLDNPVYGINLKNCKAEYRKKYAVESDIKKMIYIVVYVDGVCVEKSHYQPAVIDTNNKYNSEQTKQLIAAGAHARIGSKVAIKKDVYHNIMAAINAELAENVDELTQYAIDNKVEIVAEEPIREEAHGIGWCDKCQSYCFGDCEAN